MVLRLTTTVTMLQAQSPLKSDMVCEELPENFNTSKEVVGSCNQHERF